VNFNRLTVNIFFAILFAGGGGGGAGKPVPVRDGSRGEVYFPAGFGGGAGYVKTSSRPAPLLFLGVFNMFLQHSNYIIQNVVVRAKN